MSSIAVIGTGYVGLTTAACLADLGHQVIAHDIDQTKIATLKKGKPTIYEPGLDEVMSRAVKSSRLRFTSDYGEAIPEAEYVFVAVGTPMGRRGEADLVFVKQAAKSIAGAMSKTVTIVNKSTVPIGTGDIVSRIVGENLEREIPFAVVSNPEFLREGSAIHDFMHPDRLVLGRRIGPLFLDAGIGYGGSCFPKDVKALARMAETLGYHPELLDAVMEINVDQRTLFVEKLREVLGGLRDQVIAILGLAYKPN